MCSFRWRSHFSHGIHCTLHALYSCYATAIRPTHSTPTYMLSHTTVCEGLQPCAGPTSQASSVMRATSARAASAAPQGRPAPPPSSPPSSAALPRCARHALALRSRYLRGAAPLFTAPRPSGRPPRASSPRTSGSVTAEYARSPYRTPHLAGASAPGWSTLAGGSEHVGPHVFFYSTTPRLTSLPAGQYTRQ